MIPVKDKYKVDMPLNYNHSSHDKNINAEMNFKWNELTAKQDRSWKKHLFYILLFW